MVLTLNLSKGLKEFLVRTSELKIPVALGTGGSRENIEFMLDSCRIRNLVSTIISENEVKTSKPDPETFLKSAEKLRILPSNCIVFEDVPKGIEAARNAGMRAVAILTSHRMEDFAEFDNIIITVIDYSGLEIADLIRAH